MNTNDGVGANVGANVGAEELIWPLVDRDQDPGPSQDRDQSPSPSVQSSLSSTMTIRDFLGFADDLFERARVTLAQASLEYGEDRSEFSNFVGIAEFLRRYNPRLSQITPQDVAWIYRFKHIISMIKGVSLREDMQGRVIDDLNYGLLIAGMNKEEAERGRVG